MSVTTKVYLTWDVRRGAGSAPAMGVLALDAVTSTTLDANSTITAYPVEQGPDVTDHAREAPQTFTLEGIVTETPMPSNPKVEFGLAMGSHDLDIPSTSPKLTSLTRAATNFVGNLLSPPQKNALLYGPDAPVASRIKFVTDTLMDLRAKKALIRVITGKGDIDNMLLAAVSVVREAPNGGMARFVIELQQVRLVQSRRVAAPQPAEPLGALPVSKGSQATKQAAPQVSGKLKSLAAGLTDTGVFGGVIGGLAKPGGS